MDKEECKNRQVIAESDIDCLSCGHKLLIEEPGSETKRWLHCHNCGQYHYLVGNIHCCYLINKSLPTGFLERVRKALMGSDTLLPEIKKQISERELLLKS